MRELTDTTPKSMLPVFNRPILEYKLDALPEEIDEVILVVGYLGSLIQGHFGGEYKGKRILYVEQEVPTGTANALWEAKGILKGVFVVMNGDDLYVTEDIRACMEKPWAMLVQERDPLGSGGKVVVDENGRIQEIQEGAHKGPGLLNTGLYVLDERIFSYTPVPKGVGESEFGLPQTMMTAVGDIVITAVPATSWIQITAPEDLKKAEQILEWGAEKK